MQGVYSKYDAEQTLAAELRSGSREAFAKMYDKYAPALFGYLLKVLGDKTKAEDALQTTFREIWTCRNKYDGRERLFTWMLRLAKKAAAPHIVAGNTINKEIQNSIAFVSRNGDSITRNDEVHSKILVLMHYNQYSVQKASEVLNMNDEHIKLALRSAIKNLKPGGNE